MHPHFTFQVTKAKNVIQKVETVDKKKKEKIRKLKEKRKKLKEKRKNKVELMQTGETQNSGDAPVVTENLKKIDSQKKNERVKKEKIRKLKEKQKKLKEKRKHKVNLIQTAETQNNVDKPVATENLDKLDSQVKNIVSKGEKKKTKKQQKKAKKSKGKVISGDSVVNIVDDLGAGGKSSQGSRESVGKNKKKKTKGKTGPRSLTSQCLAVQIGVSPMS